LGVLLRGLLSDALARRSRGTGLSTPWRFQPSRCSIASHQQNRLRNETKDDDGFTLLDNDTFAVVGLEDDRFAPIVLREALNFDLHHMKPFILHA
jgi:hypothetical protein